MAVEREAVVAKLEGDINELKTEGKITGFKIYRIEKSLDDLKEVLERLTDVYHNQSMIQKDIVSIFKEVSDIKSNSEHHRQSFVPIQAKIADHITSVKTGTKIAVALATLLYGSGAWVINQSLSYTAENNVRISSLEKQAISAGADALAIKTSVTQLEQSGEQRAEVVLMELSSLRKILDDRTGPPWLNGPIEQQKK